MGAKMTWIKMFSKWGMSMQGFYVLSILQIGVSDGFLNICGYIVPESPVVLSIGSNFTAFCILLDDCRHGKIGAEQVIWKTKTTVVPKEQYSIINKTISSVTFSDTSTLVSPLTCNAELPGGLVQNIYGIQIQLGYPPEKPTNLSCIVIQTQATSFIQRCSWEPGRDTLLSTNYTLKHRPTSVHPDCIPQDSNNSCTIPVVVFFVTLEVWVEAKNELGVAESDHIEFDPITCVKPLPPHKLSLNSGKFPKILMLSWENSLNEPHELKYKIQYKILKSNDWNEIPPEDTASTRTSFTLQELRPNTEYQIRLCCAIHSSKYWSEWNEVIGFTAEDKPSKGPALWRNIETSDSRNWTLGLLWKELSPSEANGVILKYEVSISGRPPLSFPTRLYTLNTTKLILNVENRTYDVSITAFNKIGKSPTSVLLIPATNSKAPVKNIVAFPEDGKLWVNWTPPKESVSKYIIEWQEACSNLSCPTEWQQEPGSKRRTFLKGTIKPYKCYIITVYPLYIGGQGAGESTQAYLKQDVPATGPSVRTKKLGKFEAVLEWEPLSVEEQNGFIKNYTISYRTATGDERVVAVDPSKTEYLLSSLLSNTLYIVHMTAYTESGGTAGSQFTFSTNRFEDGEIEAIVVPVCIAFLLVTLVGVLVCFSKRDMIKKHIWPNVPDPSKSVIAQWSPQTPAKHFNSKEEMYPEGSFTDVSVVEIEAEDKKSLSDQDLKPFDLLRKEKNASEGHSSGIGGSSCMSSPRQSVSDSDEGEPAQNTSSTVQYSTVIPSGYRDQIPSVQVFARSESTQPLLDLEERPEDQQLLVNDSAMPKHRYFKQNGSWDDTATDFEKVEQISPVSEEDTTRLPASQMGESSPDTDKQGMDFVGAFSPNLMEQAGQLENNTDMVTNEEVPKSYLPQTVQQGGYMPQ
ncbi:interleukin-6 receptor subunit beta isoform X2 [Thamnophis elegans]|uniref:interleukin-6 receptor subunit beta isoform X2 n=1 Tax=Thamnophis elegans TaxID=35005 RepID=UPI0013777B36|nr:interleukin-6 receptor subunit beta isoform X2 [Thamnophis elegans]